MKKLIKSLLSMVIVLSMCIGLISTAGAANLTIKDISEMDFDSQSTDFYEGVSLLMGLGILRETDSFPANLGEGITRAHFLEFVMRFMLDGADTGKGKELPFTDVDTSASYYGALSVAVAQGVIKEDTLFRPNDCITYEEALTIMFRVYDLDAILDPTLPWPQNYINLATKLKLYKGEMILDHDGCLTYEGFFKLMGDVLEAKVVEANFKTGGVEYTISDDKYMEVWYDTYEFEGTVEANGITNLYSDGVYKDGYLLIDGKYYYSGDKYQQYLGYDVEGFYRKDDNDTIISISKKYCKELIIKANDIEGITVSGGLVNIRYDDNGKKKDAKVSTSAPVIYNGKAFANDRFYQEWYDISRGSIKLVTKNGSTYDIAFIDEYESYVVTGVDTKEDARLIYLKDSEPVALEDAEFYEIKKDGKTIDLEDVKSDSVVSLKKAYDNSRLEIIVSEEKFTSPLTSYSLDDKLLYFGARKYEVESETFINSLSLGINYDVYVDAFGYIVDCVNAAEDDVNVGYIIAAQYKTWPKEARVLMLKEGDEEPFEYLLADKVKIDGENVKLEKIVSDATLDTPTGAFFGGSREPMAVVIYKFNSDGKISYIDTEELGDKEDIKTTLYKKIDGERLYNKNDKFGAYDSSSAVSGIVKSKIAVNKNTMYINVPTGEEDEDGNIIPPSYEDYETISSVADEEWYSDLQLYTHGNEGLVAIAGVFRGLGTSKSIGDKDLLSVVSKISFVEKDDDWVRRITLVRNGVESNVYVDSEDEKNAVYDDLTMTYNGTEYTSREKYEFAKLFDSASFIPQTLSVGDAVSYKVDTRGYLTVLKKYYDYNSQTLKDNERFNTTVRIGGGYIEKYEGGFYGIVVDPDNFDPANLEVLAKPSSGYIYEVQGKELLYEPMTNAHIIPFSSAGTGATIYVSKLGWEVNRSYVFYRGQASNKDKYGDLKADFYESFGAEKIATIIADAQGNIILPENTTVNPGNEFLGWSDGRDVFAPGETYTLTNFNANFYPVWSTSYRHSFVSDSQSATGSAPSDIWAISGESITLPENPFTNIGWEFMGWSDGTNTYQPGTAYLTGERDVEFKAIWQQARTATFVAPSADYTGTAPVAISKLAGSTITLPENTFTNSVVKVGTFEFSGWKLGNVTYQAGDSFVMPDANVEFTATFSYVPGTAVFGDSKDEVDTYVHTYTPATDTAVAKNSINYNNTDYVTVRTGLSSGVTKIQYITFDVGALAGLNISEATLVISHAKNSLNSNQNNGYTAVNLVTNMENTFGAMSLSVGSNTGLGETLAVPNLIATPQVKTTLSSMTTAGTRNFNIKTLIEKAIELGENKITLRVVHHNERTDKDSDGYRIYQAGHASRPTLTITTTN